MRVYLLLSARLFICVVSGRRERGRQARMRVLIPGKGPTLMLQGPQCPFSPRCRVTMVQKCPKGVCRSED